MKNEFQQANLFEISGNDIQITYASSGFEGIPLFSYRDSKINRQFNGDEIQYEQTKMGELLTVIIEETPDSHRITFSVILSAVNVIPGSAGIFIQVPGITTTTHTSISGTVLGPTKTYSHVHLTGNAQVVTF